MFVSYRRVSEMGKLLLIFMACTFIFYQLFLYLNDVIKPAQPYHEPDGKSLKVMKSLGGAEQMYADTKRRLFDFYYYGE
ncbi:DUF4227 family protein [Aneurinibacillus uraniidurans]|uniref:DUF4227 family protein n=1 Tax=Aneurinibacillus uraniidurans TaxID=2966586 RepID=UPI00234AA974|nr:DUF4227 family protein [Aneurinibacillus sp. B1]WCN36860.1 DUF4227 family protein [Aneurinibacillus sp. B1]